MTDGTGFTRLLVANRGEIAVRVMRTARAMGYGTVAVHSTADAGAEHVRFADAAVCIGGAAPADSYLRVEAIIDAAKATGADAIHPGYGFLAENPALPEACAAAGVTFVGPGADAIRAMGDKAGAKALMQAAGVPCVPGWQGEDQSAARLAEEAARIGFPVMIKAVAGGGGRGMRLVERAEAFPSALASARSEALGAFGSDVVLLEKAIRDPRHVEIQVMADRHGAVIHLGERDCSVQRRHQKLIEEAPSPAVSDALRARMGAVSVAAAQAIGYVGAGTFEYLLDADGAFYFMEMNTRLQVEHPVTEAVTGLDLVELQLRVAAGERLPLTQEEVRFEGHAIEARLCAEDPGAGFMPQSGTLALWSPAEGIRADHALRDGAEVPPHYDSMIAKLIAHGPSRDDARRRLIAGLGATAALGVRTNKAFLADCLDHPVFAAGRAGTGFVAAHGPEAADGANGVGAEEARAAMVAAAILRAGPGLRLTHGYSAPMRLARGGAELRPAVRALRDGRVEVEMGGAPPLSLRVLGRERVRGRVPACEGVPGGFSGGEGLPGSAPVRETASVALELDGAARRALLLEAEGRIWLELDGRVHDWEDLTFAPAVSAAAAGGDGRLRAAMNGAVTAVNVAVGDAVAAGQVLAVLEAMKMEHAHASPVAGRVTAVHAAPGMQVSTHAVLVEVAPETEGA